MRKLIAFVLLTNLFLLCSLAQVPPPPQEPTTIQTPFGTIQVPPAAPNAAPAQPPQAPPVAPPPAVVAPAPAVPTQTQQAPPPGAAANISLNLNNADIYQVIRIICDALGLSYVIDPAVKGTVNVITAMDIRQSDLLPLLETILKINGATMLKNGNFYEIVPAKDAIRQVLPIQDSNSLLPGAAAEDQMITQIVRMKFVAAAEMARVISPYLSDGAHIDVIDAANILLITERRSNLRRLLELVDIFDSNAFEGERVRMMPVKNNLARDLIDDLKTVFTAYALSQTGTAIRFIPIERMNSILVVTPNPSVFDEVEKWLARLDQPQQTAGRRTYVYKLRHSKAADIQKVLVPLYGSGTQLAAPPTAPQPEAGAQPGGFPAAPPQAGPTANPIPNLGIVVTGTIRIIADEINNALVIQTTPQVYTDIERTIQLLDLQPRQVLIDVQIYEVALTDSLTVGVSALLQNRGTLANLQTTASFNPPTLAVQTFALIGRTRELILFLNASENRSRVRTLSAPSVLVSDNLTAEFQVGAEIPIPTTSSVSPVQSGGTNLFAQTIQFRDTGVIMRVKPQINEGGSVALSINQEVSQASANTTSSIQAPVIGKSSISSNIIISDGQTIAMGGFIRESTDNGEQRLPLLGRLPVVGALFGNTARSKSRSELVILITPHVITTSSETDLATEELKQRLTEIKKLMK